MKRYEAQLKNMLIYLGEGFAIGIIVGFIISWISNKEISGDFFAEGVVLGLLIGSAVSMILMSTKGVQNAAVNSSLGFIRNMFRGLFSAGVGSGLLLFIFLLKIMFYMIVALVVFLFMMVSFPLTIIYTVVMFMIEKSGKEIDEATADKLDKLVPVLAFVITAIIVYILFKGDSGNSKETVSDYSKSESTVTESVVEDKEEKQDNKEKEVSSKAEEPVVTDKTEEVTEVVTEETDGKKQLSLGDYDVSTGVKYWTEISDAFIEKGIYSIEVYGFNGPYYVPKSDFENVKKGDTYSFDDWEYYCIDITEEGYWYCEGAEATLDNWYDEYFDILWVKTTEEEDGKYPVYFKSVESVSVDIAGQKQMRVVDEKITLNCAKDCIVNIRNEEKPISEIDVDQMKYMGAEFEFDEDGNISYLELYQAAG